MTTDKRQVWAVTFLVALIGTATAQGQNTSDYDYSVSSSGLVSSATGVSGHGVNAVERPASWLRMGIVLSGEGSSLENALGDLKSRRQAAVELAKKLGAEVATIVVTLPVVVASSSALPAPRRNTRNTAMLAVESDRSPAAKEKDAKKSIVAAAMAAQWPLAGATAEELLIAKTRLEEKLRAANFGGKQPGTLTSEEKAVKADSDVQNSDLYDPAEPTFVCLASISPEDRQKALADAIAKAKAEAEYHARAAGVRLGKLVDLVTNETTPQNAPLYSTFSPSVASTPGSEQQLLQLRDKAITASLKDNQALGDGPCSIEFRFVTLLVYHFAKEKPAAPPEKNK